MDTNSRAFARNMFRLKVYESEGQAYEDLFINIMARANPNFKPVKPQGNIGDRKNDGYDNKTGTYYQVYAPEDLSKSQTDALKKIERDFSGLKAFWDGIYPVQEFYFVLNDKYQGTYPTLQKEVAQIGTKHGLKESHILGAHNLENILFSLADDIIVSIVGHIPSLDNSDFLFLTGFTYFMGAWIEFEKVSRAMLESDPNLRKPVVGLQAIKALHDKNILPTGDIDVLDRLRKKRNSIIHGDSYDVPLKTEIDKLVLITEKLRTAK